MDCKRMPGKLLMTVVTVVVAAGALAVALFAEPTAESSPPIADAGGSACESVDAPMRDISTVSAAEPRLRLPQPAGWEPVEVQIDGVSGVTQFAMASGEPTDTGLPRNVVVVTSERMPVRGPAAAFDRVRSDLIDLLVESGFPTDMTYTSGTTCGLSSETMTYAGDLAGPAQPVTSLWVVAESGADTYLTAVTVTVEPDNPRYQRDAETILDGVQVLPAQVALRL